MEAAARQSKPAPSARAAARAWALRSPRSAIRLGVGLAHVGAIAGGAFALPVVGLLLPVVLPVGVVLGRILIPPEGGPPS